MTVSLTATVGLILATCRRETALLRSSVWLGWLAVAMAIGLPAPVVASIAGAVEKVSVPVDPVGLILKVNV